MQRHALGVASLEDVFLALLDGAKASVSEGEGTHCRHECKVTVLWTCF